MSNPMGDPVKGRKGGCILTYTGKVVFPFDPRPDEIDFYDIAHALSCISRFTGHTESIYTVAQHSVIVSEECQNRLARPHKTDVMRQVGLDGLMHDASEAYLGDLAGPSKRNSTVGNHFRKAEDTMMQTIAPIFGVTWPKPELVDFVDKLVTRTEQRDLMPYPNELYSLDGLEMLEKEIVPWSPEEAEIEFIDRFKELSLEGAGVGLSQV